jgi:hypothetical protein
MPNEAKRKEVEPEYYTLVEKTSGRSLKLQKTVDNKGVVFYEAPLEWRIESKASDS